MASLTPAVIISARLPKGLGAPGTWAVGYSVSLTVTNGRDTWETGWETGGRQGGIHVYPDPVFLSHGVGIQGETGRQAALSQATTVD